MRGNKLDYDGECMQRDRSTFAIENMLKYRVPQSERKLAPMS